MPTTEPTPGGYSEIEVAKSLPTGDPPSLLPRDPRRHEPRTERALKFASGCANLLKVILPHETEARLGDLIEESEDIAERGDSPSLIYVSTAATTLWCAVDTLAWLLGRFGVLIAPMGKLLSYLFRWW